MSYLEVPFKSAGKDEYGAIAALQEDVTTWVEQYRRRCWELEESCSINE